MSNEKNIQTALEIFKEEATELTKINKLSDEEVGRALLLLASSHLIKAYGRLGHIYFLSHYTTNRLKAFKDDKGQGGMLLKV